MPGTVVGKDDGISHNEIIRPVLATKDTSVVVEPVQTDPHGPLGNEPSLRYNARIQANNTEKEKKAAKTATQSNVVHGEDDVVGGSGSESGFSDHRNTINNSGYDDEMDDVDHDDEDDNNIYDGFDGSFENSYDSRGKWVGAARRDDTEYDAAAPGTAINYNAPRKNDTHDQPAKNIKYEVNTVFPQYDQIKAIQTEGPTKLKDKGKVIIVNT